MKTLSRILAFAKLVIDAWNSVFGGKEDAREAEEKQKAEAASAASDNAEAKREAAQKAEGERKRRLKDLQGGGGKW